MTWGDVFTYLIIKGFNFETLHKLTLRQIQFFYGSLQKQDRFKMASDISTISLGCNGGKDAVKVVKDLQK